VSHMDVQESNGRAGGAESVGEKGNQVGAFSGRNEASRGPLGGRRATCGTVEKVKCDLSGSFFFFFKFLA
jgi:hypothetical protein